jgi:hypothetical protein
MSLVSVLGCGTWFFPIEEQLYLYGERKDHGQRYDRKEISMFLTFPFYDVSLYSCDILFSTP